MSGGQAAANEAPEDWVDRFYLLAFLDFALADRKVERRELVWIRRFFQHRGRPEIGVALDALLERGEGPEPAELEALLQRAAEGLSIPQKRRFVYDLAQLCKSTGVMSSEEYARLLDLAGRLGIDETEADEVINSVFNINDSFQAIIGLLALGVILFTTRAVIVPIVIAIFITMIISRLEGVVAGWLKLGRFRWLSKVGAMVLILGGLFVLVVAAFISGADMTERFPFYQDKLTSALQEIEGLAARYGVEESATAGLIDQVKQLPLGGAVSGVLGSLVDFLSNFLLIAIFAGFLVFSSILDRGILQEMNEKVSAYISTKAAVSLLTGGCVLVLCLLCGVDFALLWAILCFVLNFIPSIGSVIASIPPVLLAMIQLDSWPLIGVFAVGMIAIQMSIGNVLEPKLMGSRLSIKPVAILFGLIFWGFLWGIPGMFLAAPLMVLLRILASYFNFSRSFERLLAAD